MRFRAIVLDWGRRALGLSAAVSAMDPPKNSDSNFYGWLYRFTHLLAANLDRVIRPSMPGIIQNQTHIQNEENE